MESIPHTKRNLILCTPSLIHSTCFKLTAHVACHSTVYTSFIYAACCSTIYDIARLYNVSSMHLSHLVRRAKWTTCNWYLATSHVSIVSLKTIDRSLVHLNTRRVLQIVPFLFPFDRSIRYNCFRSGSVTMKLRLPLHIYIPVQIYSPLHHMPRIIFRLMWCKKLIHTHSHCAIDASSIK